jgi:site-specific recombinase XerD
MSAEDYQKAIAIDGVKGQTIPRGRALGSGELRAIFETCAKDRSAAGRRDAALLAVLYGSGLRRSEAVTLDLDAYDAVTGALTIRAGKGQKDRISYASAGSRQAVASWIATRGDEPGPLFVPINKGGRIIVRRMTDQAVLYTLQRRATQAGVSSFSPHDLRRTFVSDLLDAGADIATVQRLAGHANVATTARYDRRGEVTKQKAVELLHVPYVAPKGV